MLAVWGFCPGFWDLFDDKLLVLITDAHPGIPECTQLPGHHGHHRHLHILSGIPRCPQGESLSAHLLLYSAVYPDVGRAVHCLYPACIRGKV
uniref:Uncharacterized protein n=1 Tax=Anguilla anguilla TaxID=7936 RepID=A0A0E9XPB0_ANGAN